MRPDFEAKTSTMKMNPVTQMMEPYLPWYSKIPRKVTSFVVVIFMVSLIDFNLLLFLVLQSSLPHVKNIQNHG